MATLTPLHGAFPLDASDGTLLSFTADQSPHVRTSLLDDITDPFLTMDTLSYYIEYNETGRTDDTLILSIRIVNGGTILAAADNTGTFQTVDLSVIGSETSGPIGFNYVNGTADLTTWNGGVIELEQTINRSMGADGCRIQVDYVEFTGTYTPSVQTFDVVHTTDVNVGFFVAHTTDLNVSEFTAPIVRPGSSAASPAHKIDSDSSGTVWLVGMDSTGADIRLWEGPASGPGFWQLHDFTPGGTVRDMAVAVIGDTVHVVFITHSGSTITQYHSEWSISGASWTHNGAYGTGESHSDQAVSTTAEIDINTTSDGELVTSSRLYTYVSFAGSTAYRMRKRVYRSSSESFSGVSGHLYEERYGPNIFDKPAANSVHILYDGYVTNGFDYQYLNSSDVLSDRVVGPRGSPSQAYWEVGRSGFADSMLWQAAHDNRLYASIDWNRDDDPDFYRSEGVISAAVGGNELVYDESTHIVTYDGTSGTSALTFYLFTDHYGNLGAVSFHNNYEGGADEKFFVHISNGLGDYFATDYLTGTYGTIRQYYIGTKMVDRSIPMWYWTSSTNPMEFIGTTVTTWYRAHTTDLIVSNKPAVTHTTDLAVRNDIHAITSRADDQMLRRWWLYNGNYYLVIGAFYEWKIWKSPDLRNHGTLLTSQHMSDIIAAGTGTELPEEWDATIDSNGVIHFLFIFWENSRFEAHHSEYDIGLDTWTHNGAFHTSATQDQEALNSAWIVERTNGDLIALFQINTSYFYSINSGAGFAAGTDMTTSSGWNFAGMAVDGADTHFIVRTSTSIYHWRLNGTTLSARQGTIANMTGDGMDVFPGSSKALVYNGIMYYPARTQAFSLGGLEVTHAATGVDAPTWTKTTVTTKLVDRVHGFFYGLNGVPTFVFLEAATWKLWKAWLDGGTWVEQPIGTLPVETGMVDQDPGGDHELWGTGDRAITYPDIDSDGYAWLIWTREDHEMPVDLNRHLLRVNLNPLVIHTTDMIVDQGPLKVVHTTDVIASLTSTVDHTTDLVTITGAGGTVSINHSTDLKTVNRASVVHTTDAHVAFVVDLTHTTDLHVVNTPHDLSVTITLLFDLTVTLEQGYKPEGTGLGVPRQGDQIQRIYKPNHRVVRKR